MKRLVIYFHYDAQGSLDGPCRFAIAALRRDADLMLVTNGILTEESRAWVQQENLRLMERENNGFDVGAYREALLSLGQDVVCCYEELVLMNYTLAGPVCSLAAMWEHMERRQDLDFWGLTRHYAMHSRRFGGTVPEHLQSHFLAVRKRMFGSPDFWDYWQTMKLPRSYEESVIRHETRFTGYFAERGYRWDSYVQTDDLKPVFINPIMACPKELLEERCCPFFKRRSFFTPYLDELRRTDGNAAAELYAYLQSKTSYPMEALVRSLLRTQPLSALCQNLHWHYVVAEKDNTQETDLQKQGLRLVRFVPFESEPVTDWYLRKSAQCAEGRLAEAASLFAENPLLGVLSPALPLWPKALQTVKSRWHADRSQLDKIVSVPLGNDPPPAPHAGWVLVRSDAFPQGVPIVEQEIDCWLLPLIAQQNGYYSATFESVGQAAARAAYGDVYIQASADPAAVAKQLGRLVKHKLKKG